MQKIARNRKKTPLNPAPKSVGTYMNRYAKIAAELSEIKQELRRLAADKPVSLKQFLKDVKEKKQLTDANLSGLKALKLKASKMDFRGANFSGSSMNDSDFSGSDFSGANFKYTSLSRSNLKGANFSNASFNGSYLEQCVFEGANLSGAKFIEANLSFAIFTGANLSNADFTKVRVENLSSANFSGAKNLNKAKFPEGFSPSED